jgi:hypothetical protein
MNIRNSHQILKHYNNGVAKMPIPDQIQNFYLGLLFHESSFVEVITAEKMHLT